jgi:transcriptional regulator with XRE-family HTH domain
VLFADRIIELREKKQMVQRQFAVALETDTPMYSKIERGDRRAKREQITVIAKLLQIDETELVTLKEDKNRVLNADLNMGLDNINLREDLSSMDILTMLM